MTLLKRVFSKQSELAKVLKSILGFYPNQLSLYQQAFLHKSIIQQNELKPFESNERLEFLGDAVLDNIVSNYLFNKFPFKDEGYLTQLRSKIVSRQNLNQLAVKIGLKQLIKSKLDKESRSVYGDALEALIGAIFIDKGYTFAAQFVEEKLLFNHLDLEELANKETDFKSRVIEWCQKEKRSFDFKVLEVFEGNETLYNAQFYVNNELKGSGTGRSKKRAEQLAAEQFYNTINK